MKKLFLFLLVLFIGFGQSNDAFAQANKRKAAQKKSAKKMSGYRGNVKSKGAAKRYYNLTAGINAMNYFGDIAPSASLASTDISFTRPGLTIGALYQFNDRFAARAGFSYGRIKADDFESTSLDDESKYRYVRNLSFRNDIKELNVVGIAYLYKNKGGASTRVVLNPYIFGGVAVFHHNPKALAPDFYYPTINPGDAVALPEGGTWVKLRPLQTGGQSKPYSRIEMAFPVGIGVKYKFSKSLDFSFEIGARYLMTDNIDDMASEYTNPENLKSDLARAMANRSWEPTAVASGQPRNIDQFSSFLTPNASRPGTYAGFGEVGPGNFRGTKNSNDVYTITSIQVSYVMGSGASIMKVFKKKNAKFR